ncbi:iron ABC transporter permease [Arthrobacter sp. MYb213]|uniref:FecCD family ABC transporter permease n=1 Tax=Arthrobacter sp. MYb213 TaxID=1848595 RepID=UPI000CFAF727|nr:iron ABC transporter permease [Arthrobacter sp. MYb213]PRB72624.1 ferric enterobactin transporter permease [Arthrobacter sp. MYb213]
MSRRRALPAALSLLLVLLAALCLHISIGGTPIALGDVVSSLVGMAPDERTALAIIEFRLPRSVAAILAGMGFGVAGALTQTVARNPLASPDILGVTNGAALGAVAVLALTSQVQGLPMFLHDYGLEIAAALGGILVSALVFSLVWRSSLESNRLILVGLGMSGLCAALTSWMLTLGEVHNAQQALTWMAGTVNGISWADLRVAPILIVLGIAAAAGLRNQREVLALDSDTARALGMNLGRERIIVLGLATALAIAATIIAGPLAFVALASGHASRLIARTTIPPVAHSALVGAIFVLLADLAAARLFEVVLPAGVATAVIGAPYLIFLVLRQSRVRSV